MTTFGDLRIQQQQIEAKRERIQYEETEQLPAIPKESNYNGISPWEQKQWTPPPYWQNLLPKPNWQNLLPRKLPDFEKLGFRVIVACGAGYAFYLAYIVLGKILAETSAMVIK